MDLASRGRASGTYRASLAPPSDVHAAADHHRGCLDHRLMHDHRLLLHAERSARCEAAKIPAKRVRAESIRLADRDPALRLRTTIELGFFFSSRRRHTRYLN